jgi:drug/metabolite transporter (DMT)-like permease
VVVRDSPALVPMAGCVALAELYSHPKTAWKAHPWLGPLVNVIGYGLLTGFFISAYTLWDRQGVADGAIPPVLFDAGTAYAMTILLAPFAWKRRAEVVQEWRIHRREILIMAILSPLGYILILTALTFTPVSYVAPAREASILIGSFLGAKYLKEADSPRRLGAAAAIVAGIVLLALS